MSGFGVLHWTDVFPTAVLSESSLPALLNHAAVSCANLFGFSDWTQSTSLLMLDYWITFFSADQEQKVIFWLLNLMPDFIWKSLIYVIVWPVWVRILLWLQADVDILSSGFPVPFSVMINQKLILFTPMPFQNHNFFRGTQKDILKNVLVAHFHTMTWLYNRALEDLTHKSYRLFTEFLSHWSLHGKEQHEHSLKYLLL